MRTPKLTVLLLTLFLTMATSVAVPQMIEDLSQQEKATPSGKSNSEAETQWRSQIQNNPSNAEAYLKLGDVLKEQRKLEEAVATYQKAIAINPDYADAYKSLGNTLRIQSQINEKALANLPSSEQLELSELVNCNNPGETVRDKYKKLKAAVEAYRQAIKIKQENAELYNVLGLTLTDLGELEEATASLNEAIKINPRLVEPYMNFAEVLRLQNQSEKALENYKKALEIDHNSAYAYNNLGVFLSDQGKLDEAVAHYRQSIHIKPFCTVLYINLATVLRTQRKFEDAITEYRKAIKLNPKYSSAYTALGYALGSQEKLKPEDVIATLVTDIQLVDENRAAIYNGIGQALFNQNKVDEAIAQYNKAINLNPKYAIYYNNFALALIQKNKLEDAIKNLRKAIELDSFLASAYNNLGVALGKQEKLEESLMQYRKAIETDPDLGISYQNYGFTLKNLEKLETEITRLRENVDFIPSRNLALAYYGVGIALNDDKDADEKIAAYRKAIETDPNLWNSWHNLGQALKDQTKLDETIASFPETIRRNQNSIAVAYNGLGNVLRDQNKFSEAIAAYRRASELNPKFDSAYNNLGYALANNNQLEEAITAFNQAIELNPTMAYAYNGMGYVLLKQEKIDQAIKALTKATEINPFYVEAYNGLGKAFIQKDRPDEAENYFRKVKEIQPNYYTDIDYANIQTQIGFIRLDNNQINEADKAFSNALLINPNNANAYLGIGNLRLSVARGNNEVIQGFQQKDKREYIASCNATPPVLKSDDPPQILRKNTIDNYELAIKNYRKAIEIEPKSAIAHNNLGVTLHELAGYKNQSEQEQAYLKEEAFKHYQEAIKLDEKNSTIRHNLGLLLLDLQQEKEGLAEFQKVIELDSNFPLVYNILGNLLYKQNKLDEAIVQYREALKRHDKCVIIYNNLGNALRDKSRDLKKENKTQESIETLEDAIQQYNKIINELNPKYTFAYINLGLALFEKNQVEEAITTLRKAINEAPNLYSPQTSAHALAHNIIGYIYQKEGRLESAIKEYKEALKIDKNFLVAQLNLQEAEELLAQKQQRTSQLPKIKEPEQLLTQPPISPFPKILNSIFFQPNFTTVKQVFTEQLTSQVVKQLEKQQITQLQSQSQPKKCELPQPLQGEDVLKRSVVKVQAYDPRGSASPSPGTGWVFNNDQKSKLSIVTVSHILSTTGSNANAGTPLVDATGRMQQAEKILVELFTNQEGSNTSDCIFTDTTIASNTNQQDQDTCVEREKLDLAVLEINNAQIPQDIKGLERSLDKVNDGTPVQMWGHLPDTNWRKATGIISPILGSDSPEQITIKTDPEDWINMKGYSGGPVIDNNNGRVLGLFICQKKSDPSYKYAHPISKVNNFIENHLKNQENTK